ncbi:helix-turn-helix transcriptional regulator [bacterium]|nr:helix-turn-helix transcriptional regulator [bacterium]
MNKTKVLLGRKIRELRKERKWTQEYLSELLDINPKSILRIESGQTFPTIQNIEKLSEVFNIEISDLFNNKSFADIKDLKTEIYNTIETLNDYKIRVLYNFLYAIK